MCNVDQMVCEEFCSIMSVWSSIGSASRFFSMILPFLSIAMSFMEVLFAFIPPKSMALLMFDVYWKKGCSNNIIIADAMVKFATQHSKFCSLFGNVWCSI